MPQIAQWVIGAVICSIVKVRQWDRSLPNSELGNRDGQCLKSHSE